MSIKLTHGYSKLQDLYICRGGNATDFLALFSAFLAPGLGRFSDFPSLLEVITRRREPYPNARAFMYRRFPRKMSRGNFPLKKLEFEF